MKTKLNQKRKEEYFWGEESYLDEDIYSDEVADQMLEDDEISATEAAFMHGYLGV